jgi:hypothetical protein
MIEQSSALAVGDEGDELASAHNGADPKRVGSSEVPSAYQPPAFTLTPRTVEEAMEFSRLMASSTMIPEAYRDKPGDVLVAVTMGAEVGLKPMQALNGFAMIKGRPTMYGDALIGLVRAAPQCEWIKETPIIEGGKIVGYTCSAKRRGDPVIIENTFTLDDAKTAKLLGKDGPWTQYPSRMLKMRARGFTLRDGFADVLKGIGVAEEVQDMPDDGVRQAIAAAPTRVAQIKAALAARAPQNVTPAADPAPQDAATPPEGGDEPDPLLARLAQMSVGDIADLVNETAMECGVDVPELKDLIRRLPGGKLTRAAAFGLIQTLRGLGEAAAEADNVDDEIPIGEKIRETTK